jgi:hypothetical protein
MSVHLSEATWYEHREALEEVVLKHPIIWPAYQAGSKSFDPPPPRDEPRKWTDEWGCTWQYEIEGLEGQVVGHPLDQWDELDSWRPPEWKPMSDNGRREIQQDKADGHVASRGIGWHGFLFLRLTYLRGFDNLMIDMANEDPRLDRLIKIIGDYHYNIARDLASTDIDVLDTADDLGTQTASIMGPAHFRRYLLPTYRRLFMPARQAGMHVFMHHDGYIMDIAEELLECGVSIVNPQDLVNGIDRIAEVFKGRAAIRLDVDRQNVTVFGSPGDCRELIKEEVLKLGSPAGGLEFVWGVYPPTPAANIDAVLSAMEEFRTYWVGR